MRKFLALIVVMVFLSSCEIIEQKTWNYRVTVEVNTPEGLKVGSAVRQIHAILQPRITPETKSRAKIIGDAVAVDLGDRGVLFALVDWDSYEELFQTFPYHDDPFTSEGLNYYSTLTSAEPVELDPLKKPGYPTLVMFEDIDNPLTIQQVMKWKRNGNGFAFVEDNFSENFGEGVSVKRITIQPTSAPVTNKIKTILPWLDDYYDQMLDGMRIMSSESDYPFANNFSADSFARR